VDQRALIRVSVENLFSSRPELGLMFLEKEGAKDLMHTFDITVPVLGESKVLKVTRARITEAQRQPRYINLLQDVTLQSRIQGELVQRDNFLQSLANANATLIQTSEPQVGLKKAFASLGPTLSNQGILFMVFRKGRAKVIVQWSKGNKNILKFPEFSLDQIVERFPFFQMGKEEEFSLNEWPSLQKALLITQQQALGLPILVDNELWGMVVFLKEVQAESWNSNEKSLLSSFSTASASLIKETRSRDKIQRARANLGAFLENAQGYFAALEDDGRFITLNQQFRELYTLEYAHKPETDQSFFQNLPEQEARLWKLRYDRVKQGDALTFEWETIAGVILMILSPIIQNEKTLGVAMVGTNINERIEIETALRKAKEEAEIANRSKGAFLANMSHEIRTPLNAVIGFSDLLQDQISDPVHISYLDAIQSSGKNLLLLINDILDLSKIEAGKMDLRPDYVDVVDVCKEVVGVFGLRARDKGLKMAFADESVPDIMVFIDEVRFRQILFNLMGNAVKFTEQGGVDLFLEVKYSLEEKEKVNLSMVVKDSGMGIKEEDLEQIFEAFGQQSGQSNKQFGGTGLGLSITKRLVNLMKGQISVLSREGIGSIFTVEIPLLPFKPRDLGSKAEKKDEMVIFHNPNILIVDDNPTDRLLVSEILKNHHVHLREAEDGQQAIDLIKQEPPDLILMDMRMQGLSGAEVVRRLQKLPLKIPPIYIISADQKEDIMEQILELPIKGVIGKPLDRDLLIDKLKKVLPHDTQGRQENPQAVKLPVLDQKVRAKILGNERGKALFAVYKEVLNSNNLRRIGDFNQKLRKLAEQEGWNILIPWTREIRSQIMQYNLSRVDALMKNIGVVFGITQTPDIQPVHQDSQEVGHES
jgi:signal transduction histidine kinase/DNA-binding NarL/FixJ family response regulator